ncbi:MAG: hypothetical protein QG562_266, partial [Patescibacteria group bacterium]|nr:hypothetical protein [Patescibacteria group bacterium]
MLFVVFTNDFLIAPRLSLSSTTL